MTHLGLLRSAIGTDKPSGKSIVETRAHLSGLISSKIARRFMRSQITISIAIMNSVSWLFAPTKNRNRRNRVLEMSKFIRAIWPGGRDGQNGTRARPVGEKDAEMVGATSAFAGKIEPISRRMTNDTVQVACARLRPTVAAAANTALRRSQRRIRRISNRETSQISTAECLLQFRGITGWWPPRFEQR